MYYYMKLFMESWYNLSIPANVTTLDLSWNLFGSTKKGAELARFFALIPPSVTSLNLSDNWLYLIKGDELAQAFAAIPVTVLSLDLQLNNFEKKTGAELAQAFAAIPSGVSSLNLSRNSLWNKSGYDLALAFAAIPSSVTFLDLSKNGRCKNSAATLALALAAIPSGVISLNLRDMYFHTKTEDDLDQIFAAIPKSVAKIQWGDDMIQKSYEQWIEKPTAEKEKIQPLVHLLDSYLEKRKNVSDSSRVTKEYYYGSFFSVFQKSYTQKKEAVQALKLALNGKTVDLSKHVSTLRNGKLGQELRAFIKSHAADDLVDKQVTTVREFIQALQDKIDNPHQKNHVND